MSAPADTNQNFAQAELEQLVFIVLENMKTKKRPLLSASFSVI